MFLSCFFWDRWDVSPDVFSLCYRAQHPASSSRQTNKQTDSETWVMWHGSPLGRRTNFCSTPQTYWGLLKLCPIIPSSPTQSLLYFQSHWRMFILFLLRLCGGISAKVAHFWRPWPVNGILKNSHTATHTEQQKSFFFYNVFPNAAGYIGKW